MPIRPVSASRKGSGVSSKKKEKKNIPPEDVIDPHQEQIDGLIQEREDIRLKLNIICSKIVENIDMDDYQNDIDLTKQQPCDISLDNILSMIDDICYYRTACLNLYQETDDSQIIPVQKKITQLYVEEPNIFRKRLTSEQRLTFVARERDVWKENAESLQIMYATIVDQLEMGVFKKITPKTSDILRAHRLNLEDVCLIFSSPRIRSINDVQKLHTKKTFDKDLNEFKDQHTFFELDQQNNNSPNLTENKEHQNNLPVKVKRTVAFADEVNIINDTKDNNQQQQISNQQQQISNQQQQTISQHQQTSDQRQQTISPHQQTNNQDPLKEKSSLPTANNTLVDKMDSNLRMLIIKELSKDTYVQKPLSKRSSTYGVIFDDSNSYQQQPHRSQNKSSEWVELARLVGIDQSEIDHWLSQSLQYPAGRVISTWCNKKLPAPTVAELHSLLSSNELSRLDLARHIELMYNIR